ncbi:type II toxin-antitoxin system Phd/YefM family antitoxin [Endozoicomonas arenosclerae]|uniref:type II toxin-antitoxin system Phd/YefM family antitoxin n=1 Tax=Endozoicomonas arenosclerae TaxID=1633495 RepID=UPI0007818CAF|nr:type II toxin-antitoxin system prevent-host-death family antitoxin [Endozoicomonas arenosclerae]
MATLPEHQNQTINMHEAKSRLSQLGEAAWKGERVIISRAGKPYLELIPYKERKPRKPGNYKGKIRMSDDFDDTPDDVIDAFEGNA